MAAARSLFDQAADMLRRALEASAGERALLMQEALRLHHLAMDDAVGPLDGGPEVRTGSNGPEDPLP